MKPLISILTLLLLITSISQTQYLREINRTIPLAQNGRVAIDTYKGSIFITTHNKQQVEINIKIETDGTNGREAMEYVKNTEIDMRASDNAVSLRTDYDKLKHESDFNFWEWLSNFGSYSNVLPLVHYTIRVPINTELRIKDYKSDINIKELSGPISINTYKGNVEITDFTDGINLETYKGNAQIIYTKLAKNSYFETYKGKIIVSIPKQSGFGLLTNFEKRVDFYTDFNVDERESRRKIRNYNYSTKINGGGPLIEFTSKKGTILLKEL